MYENDEEKINIREGSAKEKILSMFSGRGIFVKIALFFLVAIIIIAVAMSLKLKTKTGEEKTNVSGEKKVATGNSEVGKPGKVVEIDNLNEELPASPEVIAQGKFNNVEQEVLGKALFIKGEKGTILRFEDFNVINGQNLHVYLSPIQGMEADKVVDLGLLKATSGNFNYDLDKSIDVSKYNNVLIWSTSFNAFFGYAGLYTKDLAPETPKTTTEQKEVTKKQ